MENYIYLVLLLFFTYINFNVLIALHVERKFEKNALWQIKYAYIVVSVLVAHFITLFILYLGNLF